MYNIFLSLLLLTKIIWILLIILYHIAKYNKKNYKNILLLSEEYVNLFYSILIAILIIYLFNHLQGTKVCVEGKEKTYLYLFGILILIESLIKFYKKIFSY